MNTKSTLKILLVGLMLICAATAFAQPGGGRGGRGGGRGGGQGGPPAMPDSTQVLKTMDEMADALELSADQKIEITDLHFAHFAKAQTALENSGSDRDSHRKAMDVLREELQSNVKALLSDDQKDAYEEFTKNNSPRGGRARR